MQNFKIKYEIEKKYLPVDTKRRSGAKLDGVKFLVKHDTGNPDSTAYGNVNYYINSCNYESASAHLFVDDKHIVECIPTGLVDGLTPEKAWHVVYNTPIDNQMYGCDANDNSIGIEYSYGSNIDAHEAYKRYVWISAYLCYVYKLDPSKDITGHFILDPSRKTDPKSGLQKSLGITFEQLIIDVVNEYKDCLNNEEENEMSKVLEYDVWAWNELDQYLGEAYNEGIITDWKWVQAARDKKLTYSELILLKVLIDERRRKKNG